MAENNISNNQAQIGQSGADDQQTIQLADLWAMIWHNKWW